MKVRSGLLGRKLSHSYSPEIHGLLGDYEYRLFEMEEKDVPAFLREGDFTGVNVTIPYKKTVLPYMSSLSRAAETTGSVNTIIRAADGSLFGDNTDVYGFSHAVASAGIEAAGKKALVLGSGGASASVIAALGDLGAEAVVISRTGENNYGNISRHYDAEILVNTTPVGMYPGNGETPLCLRGFSRLEAVFDLIYNPARTALLAEAESLGIRCVNGLRMLVAQAKKSSGLFTGRELPDEVIDSVVSAIESRSRNIILVGMPGCGKSSVGKALAGITGRTHIDADGEITALYGKKPSEIILSEGEERFRSIETDVLRETGRRSGVIISTGGGAVTREENYYPLHQNGVIIWLKRDIEKLPLGDRPVSRSRGLRELYGERRQLYERFADARVDSADTVEETAKRVLAAFDSVISADRVAKKGFEETGKDR